MRRLAAFLLGACFAWTLTFRCGEVISDASGEGLLGELPSWRGYTVMAHGLRYWKRGFGSECLEVELMSWRGYTIMAHGLRFSESGLEWNVMSLSCLLGEVIPAWRGVSYFLRISLRLV